MSLEDAQERDQVRLFLRCQDEADTGASSEQSTTGDDVPVGHNSLQEIHIETCHVEDTHNNEPRGCAQFICLVGGRFQK